MDSTAPDKQPGQWWSAPTESATTGRLIIVSGRADIEKFRSNPRFKYRVDITLPYNADASGMPDDTTAHTLEAVTDALHATFRKDPVAVITGIYTGDNRRDWVCYTLSLHIFQKKINEALASLPLLPLEFDAEEDPDWEEYAHMYEISHIDIDESDDDSDI